MIRSGCRSRPCTSSGEIAAYGTAPELRHAIGLSYDGTPVGELIVGLRSGQHRLSPPDIAVLRLLAGPLAVAAHATALSAALQESRVGIVTAREEERRRLRRDLHDGLGPVLAGIAFKADAARNTLDADAGAGRSRPAGRAARGHHSGHLRYPAAGLRAAAARARRPRPDRVAARAVDPAGPPARRQRRRGHPERARPPAAVPAAVEVAAYRIVTEAMTNAVRHAGASRIEITLGVTDEAGLSIEVRDDGTGPGPLAARGRGHLDARARRRAGRIVPVRRRSGRRRPGDSPAASGRPHPGPAAPRTDLARPRPDDMTPAPTEMSA